jgi:hypothetical protein
MKAFEILQRFSEVRNTCTAIQQTKPISNRAKLIMDILAENGIEFEVDVFFHHTKQVVFTNIYVNFDNALSDERIVYTAHHDVVNIKSMNVLDNTASVANLLSLAIQIQNNEKLPKYKVTIAFTDNEEFGGSGSKRLAELILMNKKNFGNVIGNINLELTGRGNIWVDRVYFKENYITKKLLEIAPNLPIHDVPFNDSIIFREFGLYSICLGTMPNEDMVDLQEFGNCNYWQFCHKNSDDMSNANEGEMETFVEQLKQFVL